MKFAINRFNGNFKKNMTWNVLQVIFVKFNLADQL